MNFKFNDRFTLNAIAYYVDERCYSGGKFGDYMVTNVEQIGRLKDDLKLWLFITCLIGIIKRQQTILCRVGNGYWG